MSFNKVDEALKSVGITLQTTDHQFRNFTDVIMELAEVWDQLDSAQQRYIATQFAGNRQQSRFLALVSNKDLLKENLLNAQNSEDVGTLQALKALDSIESKLNQVQVAYQQFYTTMGIETVWKGLLDGATNVLETLNKLPKAFDTIPVSALAMATSVISFIKNVLFVGLQRLINSLVSKLDSYKAQFQQTGYNIGQSIGKGIKDGVDGATKNLPQVINNNAAGKGQSNTTNQSNSSWLKSSAPSAIGAGLVTAGALINTDSRGGEIVSGLLTGAGGAFQAVSGAVRVFSGDLSGLIPLFQGLGNIIGGVGLAIETAEERQARLVREAETLSNTAKQEKANYNQLAQAIQKYEELKDKQFESAEAAEEYQQAVNALAEIAPELVTSFDAAGNAIIDASNAEELLTQARKKSAQAALEAAQANAQAKWDAAKTANENLITNFSPSQLMNDWSLPTDWTGPNIQSMQASWDNANKALNQREHELLMSLHGGLPQFSETSEGYIESLTSLYQALNSSDLGDYEYIDNNGEVQALSNATDIAALEHVREVFNNTYSQIMGMTKMQEATNGVDYTQSLLKISQLINNYEEKEEKTVEDVLEFYQELDNIIGNDDALKTYAGRLLQGQQIFSDAITDATEAEKLADAAAKYLAASWQENQEKTYEYLTDKSGFATILNSKFSKEAVNDAAYKELSKDGGDWQNDMQMVEDFWAGLSDTKKEMFNQMFSDTASFGPSDILQLLDFSGPDTDSDETIIQYLDSIKNDGTIEALIANWYLDRIRQIQTRVKQQLESSGIRLDNIKIDAIETEDQANYISTIISRIQQLQNAGFVNTANNFQDAAEQLYTDIMDLGPELRNTVFDIIKKYGFDTVEDIENITADLANVEGLDKNFGADELKTISGTMFQNMNLTLQGAFSDFMQSWDDTSKELTQAISGGFNFKEADAFIARAQAMGMEDFGIDDFIINAEGKMVLTAEAYESFYQALLAKQDEIVTNAQTSVSEAKGNLALLKTYGSFGNKSVLYAMQKGDITEAQVRSLGITDLNISIADALVAAEEYVTANAESADEIAESWRLASEQLSKTTLKTSLTQFLSDVLSKPLGDIKINNDYPALEKATRDNLQSLISGDNFFYANFIKSFISEYKDKLNFTIQEVNDYYIQALEKDRAQTTGAAKQALDDVTVDLNGIAYASADTIKQLADAFNLDVSTLIGEYSSSMDAYAFNVEQFGRDRIAKIEGGQAALQDAISEYFKSLVDLFSNGIKGSLSYSDVNKLASELSKYNVQLNELDFTPTANGLKLSEDAAIRIYSALKDIDGIRAQLLFDDMKKSLSESGEACENISTTLASIADLERQLQSPANANNKILQDRLAIYKEIAVAQTSDPNQYKFMDRNMPAPMQGPLNYWDSVGKAYTAMNESASSGYMDVQDFYNIVNEMSNLASISGQNLEFMGQTISGSAEDAATLIEKGMSALSNIDGKGVKIDLSKLGVDISSGAESMQKGFDDGVKAMAKSQIEMLDAAIAMLEVVVAMEDLKDLDIENQGTLDLSEIFKMNTPDPNDFEGFADDYSAWATHLKELAEDNGDLQLALEKISINGHTLGDYIDAATGSLEEQQKKFAELGVSLEQYQQVMNAFYQAMLNGDYDLEHIQESVWEILNKTMPDGMTIDIGSRTIVIAGNTAVSFEWKSPGAQQILKKYQNEGGMGEKEAKQKIIDLITNYNKDENLAKEDIEDVLRVRGVYTVDKETGIVTIDGQQYDMNKDGPAIQKALAKFILKDFGYDPSKANTITTEDGDFGGFIVQGKVSAKSDITYSVISDGQSTLKYEYNGVTYESIEAMRDGIVQERLDQYIQDKGFANADTFSAATEEDLEAIKLSIKKQVEAELLLNVNTSSITIGGTNGNQPTTQQLESIVNTATDEIKTLMQQALDSGENTITLNGLQIEFEEDDTAEQIQQKAKEMLESIGLVEQIAEGIKTAFTANEGKNEISEALATGIRDALTTKSVDVGEGGAAPTVNVSELKVTAEKLTLNETEEGKKVPIDTLDATVTTLNVSTDDTTTSNYDGVSLPAQTEENKPTLDDVVEAYVKFLNLSLVDTGYDITDTGVKLPDGYELSKKDFAAACGVTWIDLTGTPEVNSTTEVDISAAEDTELTQHIASVKTAVDNLALYSNGALIWDGDESNFTYPTQITTKKTYENAQAFVTGLQLSSPNGATITAEMSEEDKLLISALSLGNLDGTISSVNAKPAIGTEIEVETGGLSYSPLTLGILNGWLSSISASTADGDADTPVTDDGINYGDLEVTQPIKAKILSLTAEWAANALGIKLPTITKDTKVSDITTPISSKISEIQLAWADGTENFTGISPEDAFKDLMSAYVAISELTYGWANGENIDDSAILSLDENGNITLPAQEVVLPVTKITTKFNTGFSMPNEVRNLTGSNDFSIEKGTELANIGNDLLKFVSQGNTLTPQLKGILETIQTYANQYLTTGTTDTETQLGQQLSDIAEAIEQVNTENLEKFSTITDGLNNIDAANLQSVSEAITTLFTEADKLLNLDWENLKTGLDVSEITFNPSVVKIGGTPKVEAGSGINMSGDNEQGFKMDNIDIAHADINELKIDKVGNTELETTAELTLASATAKVTDLTVSAANLVPDAGVKELQGIDFSGTTSGLSTIAGKLSAINGATFSNFDTLSGKLATIQGQLDTIVATINQLTDKEINVNLHTTGNNGGSNNGGTTTPTSGGSTNAPTVDFTDMLASLSNAVGEFGNAMTSVQSDLNSISTDSISDAISKVGQAIGNVPTGGYAALAVQTLGSAMADIPNTASRVSSLARAMNNIPSGTQKLNVRFDYTTKAVAAGNMGAMATGNTAMAGGTRRTLMGELGPELVVSNGRYFVVGQGGAEFVDLAEDAIVFNHLQTRRLIEQGAISSRGKPFTNEINAVSYAKGNNPLFGFAHDKEHLVIDNPSGGDVIPYEKPTTTTVTKTEKINSVKPYPTYHSFQLYSFAKGNMAGPAMASAKAALAALKEIRAMWQAMLDSSPKNLGALAGRGGGGRGKGGGGKNGNGDGSDSGGEGEETTPFQLTAATAEIQRWYNLLRQIERLEKDITYQEQLQNNLLADQADNGELIYQSYKTELDFLDEEIVKQKQLLELQKSWLEARVADLTNPEKSVIARIFTYDPEKRLLQYRGDGTPGSGVGLDILEQLNRRDINGQGLGHAANSEEQLKYLEDLGVDLSMLTYKDDGTRIAEFDATGKLMDAATHEWLEGEELDSARTEMVERFFELVESEMDEIDSLQESIEDTQKSILEEEAKANEILQKLIDNQLEIEQSVLKAITDREQGVIDALKDEKDAINDAANKFVDGLSEQLNREREMYNQNNQNEELIRLQRQLAILQRAGGSAAQIKSLQDQITAKQRDAYFDAQQNQIDAIKDASDKEIERLDAQLNIMTETLEYQKEHGLLWSEVYSVMNDSKNAILNFISTFDEAFKPISALDFDQKLIELGDKIGQWIAYRDDTNTAINNNKPTLIAHNATQGWDTFAAAYSDAYSDVWNQEYSNIKAAYEDELAKTGDTNAADAAALKYLWDKTGRALPLIDAGGSALPVQKTTYSSVTGHAKPKETSSSGGGVGGGDIGDGEHVLPDNNNDDDTTTTTTKHKNSAGYYIEDFQAKLIQLGYLSGNGDEAADGINGNKTKEAVREFQRKNNLTVDGEVGVNTWNKLMSSDAIAKNSTPTQSTNYDYGQTTPPSGNTGSVSFDSTDTLKKISAENGQNIRKEKSANSSLVGFLSKGTPVALIRNESDNWKYIKFIKDNQFVYGYMQGSLSAYKHGGLIDFTGPAWVDGSKTRPEGILNADETEFFRNDFMHSAHLLTSVMRDLDILVDDMSDTSRYNGIGSTESINIENAQVIMNVDSIASDYDAQRAGEQALEQMLKIARKSGTLSLTRR